MGTTATSIEEAKEAPSTGRIVTGGRVTVNQPVRQPTGHQVNGLVAPGATRVNGGGNGLRVPEKQQIGGRAKCIRRASLDLAGERNRAWRIDVVFRRGHRGLG